MMEFEIGGVYTKKVILPDGEVMIQDVRIFCYDKFEILMDVHVYDKWWLFDKLNRTCGFARARTGHARTTYQLKYQMPLSYLEKSIIRPDLPLRLARIKDLSWSMDIFEDQNALRQFLKANYPAVLEEVVQAECIVLEPLTKNNFTKGCTTITADNGIFFTTIEIITKANAIRAAINNSISSGIGIYRSGIKSKLPTYYIGEYIDLAKFLVE
jgi:hypothetical protein